MQDLKLLYDAVLSGDAKTARSFTEHALAAGVEPLKLVNESMVPAMDEVGRRFECNQYFVPELLLSARAMKAALELVRPLLAKSGAQPVAPSAPLARLMRLSAARTGSCHSQAVSCCIDRSQGLGSSNAKTAHCFACRYGRQVPGLSASRGDLTRRLRSSCTLIQ